MTVWNMGFRGLCWYGYGSMTVWNMGVVTEYIQFWYCVGVGVGEGGSWSWGGGVNA